MSSHRFYKLWGLGLLFKLILGAWLPLFYDESYYWVWSHNLQLSYYDHPPMIAWWIKLGHFLEPFANLVRWPAIILSHCTLIVWYFILREHFDLDRMRHWLALALFTPMTGVGSIILTPDLPLILFWSLSLLAVDRAINTQETKWFALLGAFLGLGFCAKYHIVLFVPILICWLVWEKRLSSISAKNLATTILLGLIFCSPVLVWNFQNDWISFRFQLDHGLGETVWKPKYTWRYLYGQIGLIFPVALYFAIRARPKRSLSWLPFFAWGPLLFFLITSFRGKVEANWPIPAYPSIIALSIIGSSKLRWSQFLVAFWIVCYIGIVAHIVRPWIPFLQHEKLKTYEFVKYKVVEPYVRQEIPVFVSTFQLASKLWYEYKTPIYKLHGMGRKDFFDYLEGSKPTQNHYYLIAEDWNQPSSWARSEGHEIVRRQQIGNQLTLFEIKKNR